MGIIELEGMEFYAYHGHYDVEKVVGNRFVVYVRLETDCSRASASDALDDALNYQSVYETIREIMKTPVNLLEHLAGKILSCLYEQYPQIDKATVKISKLNPPMGGQIEKVSVSLTR